MTAHGLKKLLADRHSGDVFIEECKMGSSGSQSLDGWALLPTWSPMTTIGYEVKVSRSDWLQDQKFENYRQVCHLFLVVAPKGIVERGELPGGVGLLEPIGSGDGQRLVMRVKPTRQQPDNGKLVSLMAYALMWKRAESDPARLDRVRRASFWATWLSEQQEFRRIGRSVKGRMRKMLAEAIDGHEAARRNAEQLQEAAAILAELKVRPGSWNIRRDIERAITEEKTTTLTAIHSAIGALQAVSQRVESAACDS